MAAKTFQDQNQLSASQQVVSYLQGKYGSANWSQLQTLRNPFYSYQTYPLAGSAQMNFFGDSIGTGGATLQDTNLPKQNSFGQVHFLLKSIYFDFKLTDPTLNAWSGLDASTFVSDIILGFFQAGYFRLNIQARTYVELPLPFQYLGKRGGSIKKLSAGLRALTLTEGTPNTLLTSTSSQPSAEISSVNKGMYQVDPNVLIEAEQNFDCSLSFPSGLVPIISTGVVTTNNPLKVGILFDGIVFRPLQ